MTHHCMPGLSGPEDPGTAARDALDAAAIIRSLLSALEESAFDRFDFIAMYRDMLDRPIT